MQASDGKMLRQIFTIQNISPAIVYQILCDMDD